jgi:tetratricopeptide (TPR) repeat protein
LAGQFCQIGILSKIKFNSLDPAKIMVGWLLYFNSIVLHIKETPQIVTIHSQNVISFPFAQASAGQVMAQTSAQDFYKQGMTKAAQKNYSGAIADFNKAIQLNPNGGLAYFQRGLAHYNRKDTREAIADYNQAIQLGPKLGIFYRNRGVARRDIGDNQGAISDLNQSIKLSNPATRGLYYFDFLYNRGLARYNLKDYREAIKDLSPLLDSITSDDIAASFAEGYYARGMAQLQIGDRNSARQNLQKAAKLFKEKNNQEGYRRAQESMQKL